MPEIIHHDKEIDMTDIPELYKTATCDNVLHPSHYCKGGVECIDAIKASMSSEAFKGYCKGNCMKYIYRYEDKGGVESLQKARVYLDWLIREVNTTRLEA